MEEAMPLPKHERLTPTDERLPRRNRIRYLPHDLISDDILTRLPAKILCQLKIVSKLWHASISDPSFINRHLDRSRCQPTGRVNGHYLKTKSHIYSSAEEGEFELDLERILPAFLRLVIIESSWDGLLVVRGFESEELHALYCHIYLCNPITRQCIELPQPRELVRHCLLVFDDTIGRYKIFCATEYRYRCGHVALLVLTLGGCEKSWREIKQIELIPKEALLFNKKVYWVFCDYYRDKPVIISVDVASEETRDIQVPALSNLQHMLTEVKGSMYLVHRPFNEHCYTTWIFNDRGEEPSWTQLRMKKYEPLYCLHNELNKFDCNCPRTGGTIIYGGEDSDLDEIETNFRSASHYPSDKIHHYSSLVDISIIQSGVQRISIQPKSWPPNFKSIMV